MHNTTRALAVKAKRTLIEDLLKNVAKHEILDHDLGSKYLDQVRAARQPVDTKLILDADLFEFSTL